MRRRSRHHRDAKDDKDRWIISYADFITLLFAFFVVMYAISTVNAGKFRVMAAHLDASFSNAALTNFPIQFGVSPLTFNPLEPKNDSMTQGPFTQSSNEFIEKEFTEVSSEFKTSLKGLVEQERIKIKETQNWIEIELKSKFLFRSASSRLLPGADDYIKPLATLLNRYNNPVQVEGFTDKVPIQNELYPSNWELSASRASSVARRLIDFGVDPVRLAAIGYGSNFPVATNATDRGREANRRVVLLIAKQPRRERLVELQKRGNIVPPKPAISAPSAPEPSPVGSEAQESTLPQTQQLQPIRTPDGGIRFTTVPGRGSQPVEQ